MQCKGAKEILTESFWELAGTKAIDKITVKDITENCGYSPATFYRHFKDKYDLIVQSHTRQVAAIMNQIGKNGYSWRQTLLEGARNYVANREIYANLLLHTSGHDAFVTHMTNINAQALQAHILKVSGKKALDEKTIMYIRTYCMGTVCLTCEWILGKYRATPEELAQVYENCLPGPLYPYLLEKRESMINLS